MFLACVGTFLVLGWIAAWLSNTAISGIVEEINSSRLHGTYINPMLWNFAKLQKVWRLHQSIAPISNLRKRYIAGISIGSVGFVIALIGIISSSGTGTATR